MESLAAWQTAWFFIVWFLLAGYALLDGLDLGLGMLLPFTARNEEERALLLDVMGPFWDGNEVWLIIASGVLFAAFPLAYATVFSGFYLAMMLVLLALILRGASFEFWPRDRKRRPLWLAAQAGGSALAALLLTLVLGNILIGVPLGPRQEYIGVFGTWWRVFPLSVVAAGLAAVLMQGATFAIEKTQNALQDRLTRLALRLRWLYAAAVLLFAGATLAYRPEAASRMAWWLGLGVTGLAWLALGYGLRRGWEKAVFRLSSLALIGLWVMVAALQFPLLVRASPTGTDITIYNASSSQTTLYVLLWFVGLGMVSVIGFEVYVYRLFRGKVTEEHTGY